MRRREVLKAGGLALLPLAPFASAEPGAPDVAIFDARHAASRRWAERQRATRLDARDDVVRLWRMLRTSMPASGVRGLTTWADFQVIRGCAAEDRLKLRYELVRPRSGGPTLVAWALA